MTPIRYAGFWIRAVAHLLDSTLLTLVAWGLTAVVAMPLGQDMNGLQAQILNAAFYLLIATPYYVWGHFRYETTLGKVIFKVRVVQEDGYSRLTLKQSILRYVLYLVSYIPLGAGYFMAGLNSQKRGLHDLLAHTVSVVGTRQGQAFGETSGQSESVAPQLG